MAIAERDIPKSMFADKEELRRIAAEQNEQMGFARVPGATAQQAREMMRRAGISPNDNEASRELLHVRYGEEAQEN